MLRPSGLTACMLAAALVWAGPALARTTHPRDATSTTTAPLTPPGALVSVQGVVQSVSASTVLVKQLDGSAVIVPVDKTTQFYVNGKPAHIGDVKRGFVLIGTFQSGRPASVLRFTRPS